MIWDMLDRQVWWEYRDGVTDDVPSEGIDTLEASFANRDISKPFVYIKPNWSNTKCAAHTTWANQHNVAILTCPKWSMYHHTYAPIVNDRTRARTFRHKNLNTHFKGRQFFLFAGTPTPERESWLAKARATWSNEFSELNIPTDVVYEHYVNSLMGASYAFQPHGIGPRHQTYECMALGVPSIIPESSYLDDVVRSCNIIVNDELPTDLPIPGSSEYLELSQRCIDAWETHMTPQAITNHVLKQL